MNALSCADILAGRAPQDVPVTVQGWVARRDSNRHLFVHLSDGRASIRCGGGAEHAAQLCEETSAHRRCGRSDGIPFHRRQGQPFEMQARALKVVGWVDDPVRIRSSRNTRWSSWRSGALWPRTNVIGAAVSATRSRRQCTAFSTRTALSGSTRRSSTSDAEGGRLFPRRRWISPTCRAPRRAGRLRRRLLRARAPSRSPDS